MFARSYFGTMCANAPGMTFDTMRRTRPECAFQA